MQDNAAHELYVERSLPERATRRFANGCVGVRQDVVEVGAVRQLSS
jgi:hypothetical protein